jgi:hypothetical protein
MCAQVHRVAATLSIRVMHVLPFSSLEMFDNVEGRLQEGAESAQMLL